MTFARRCAACGARRADHRIADNLCPPSGASLDDCTSSADVARYWSRSPGTRFSEASIYARALRALTRLRWSVSSILIVAALIALAAAQLSALRALLDEVQRLESDCPAYDEPYAMPTLEVM